MGHGASTPVTKDGKEVPHKIDQRYELTDVLGEGGYSIVKLGTSKISQQKTAVKIITRANLPSEDELALRQEVEILSSITHPNIVRALDFFEEPDFYYFVLEYMDGGELLDRIVKKSFYNEKEARDLAMILLNTIKYLHDKDIVHRDLKPENLLLSSKDDDAQIKLADFGFAVKVDKNMITDQCGTPEYMAPEIFEAKPYGKTVDMWSCGVILYVLLGGYPPFYDDNQTRLIRKVIAGEYEFHPQFWSGVSEDAIDLIKKLLTVNPDDRLTVDQAIAHPWMATAVEKLQNKNLDHALQEMKKLQARKKLKAGIQTVMAINLMGRRFSDASQRKSAIEGGVAATSSKDQTGGDQAPAVAAAGGESGK